MNALQRTINLVGGQTELARKITEWLASNGRANKIIKQQNVWKWLDHPSGIPVVPPEYRLAIQEITNSQVTVRQLSHDIYGAECEKEDSCACQS